MNASKIGAIAPPAIKAAAVLALIFVFVLAVGRGSCASDAAGLERFLAPSGDCHPPCILGITPGVTPMVAARAILRAHEWVAELSDSSGPYQTLWRWSGRQPDFFDASADGLALADSFGVVTSIRIQTTLSYADLWLALGPPDAGNVTVSRSYLMHALYYEARNHVIVIEQANCPVDLRGFWAHPVLFHFGPPFLALDAGYRESSLRRRWCR